eukprot:TRINITY_DN3328_c0_g1_i6.p1 TRINITY_DN3328_c0_g1~~TRINITY_DN3328_c0_g1_i6.p1  ORF type:complete len:397 (-),score=74.83 TRINITY_DN3328_c0_g1_i6:25-1215(-)
MSTSEISHPAKRKLDDVAETSTTTESHTEKALDLQGEDDVDQESGQQSNSKRAPYAKRKIAMLIAYNGEGYQGLQYNPGAKTLEDEIEKAIFAAGAISADNHGDFHKIGWQRAARTDKGVSALGQVVSYKTLMIPDLIEKINEHLPPQIRALDFTRVTGGFNAKNHCDGRRYSYIIPTFAFAPSQSGPSEEGTTYAPDFKFTDEHLAKIRSLLKKFEGTRNFHNYTVHKKACDPSSMRFIRSFECGEPFVKDGIELVHLTIIGQSFMLHQIRKMVGTIVCVVRGDLSLETFEETLLPKIVRTPMAPALGLFLEKCYYKGYEARFRSKELLFPDGTADPQKDAFRAQYIIPHITGKEKSDYVVAGWLRCLDINPASKNAYSQDEVEEEADKSGDGDE